jgi:two-component system sensor histidine kinase BarA
MSYRFFKRVLGETHLEAKCRWMFGVCLFLLITGSFWYFGKTTEDLVYEQIRILGQETVEKAVQFRHFLWLLNQFAGSAAGTTTTPPPLRDSMYRTNLEELHKAMVPTGSNSDFIFARHERANDSQDAEFKRIVERYKQDAEEGRELVAIDRRIRRVDPQSGAEKRIYEYFQPIVAKNECVICHKSIEGTVGSVELLARPLEEGQLLAVARIELEDSTPVPINRNRAILLATAIVTFGLSMFAAYAIVKYVIVKPLKHLRDVADEISRGEADQRADIHTGDEFEELAVSFNRMLGHLMDAQAEQRSANAKLDAKVDELAQANMKLYELNRMRSDFLATMSHELRTPLNHILGFSDVLGSVDSLNDKQKRYVQNIQKSGKMLLDMFNDVLDLAKIESGKMNVRLSEFHLAHVLGAQCDLARPLAERKNIDLECHVSPLLPMMHQDQAKLQQILNNLLSNAIKFTPEGGRIVVEAYRDERDFMVLSVSDTGVGIAEEDKATIFEKFRQGRVGVSGGDAMTREFSGTGLGLSIVKEICRLLGGSISLESELGQGSKFIVRLPWCLAAQPRLEAPPVDGSRKLEDFSQFRTTLEGSRS